MPQNFSPVPPTPDELKQSNDWVWLFGQVLTQFLENNFEYTSQRFLDQPVIWQMRYEEWLCRVFAPYAQQINFPDSTLKSLIAEQLQTFLIVRRVRHRLTGLPSPEPAS